MDLLFAALIIYIVTMMGMLGRWYFKDKIDARRFEEQKYHIEMHHRIRQYMDDRNRGKK